MTLRAHFRGLCLLGFVTGCGGGAPLLHPAQVEPEGQVTGTLGISAQFLAGDASRSLRQARENTSVGSAVASTTPEEYRRGALALATLAPGIAPWVGARVGLGFHSEAEVATSGRLLRVGGRYALQEGGWALSLGVGGQAVLPQGDTSEGLRGVNLSRVRGYGLDLPLLVGWQSEGGQFSFWTGGRVGYEQQKGRVGLDPDGSIVSFVDWTARRWWGGGVWGMKVGIRSVFVALELAVAHHEMTAGMEGSEFQLAGLTWTPAAALLGRF